MEVPFGPTLRKSLTRPRSDAKRVGRVRLENNVHRRNLLAAMVCSLVACSPQTSAPKFVGKWMGVVEKKKFGVEYFSDKTWIQTVDAQGADEGTYSVLDDGRVKMASKTFGDQTAHMGSMVGGDLLLEFQMDKNIKIARKKQS